MTLPSSKRVSGGPKIIAFHSIILLSDGAAINPLGASSFMLQDEQQQRITIGIGRECVSCDRGKRLDKKRTHVDL